MCILIVRVVLCQQLCNTCVTFTHTQRISEDYNDRIRTMKSKIEQALKKHAATMCDPLPVILDTVHERMAELHRIAGPTTIQTIIDRATRACDGPQLLPFTTYWHNYVEQRKPRARINGEEPPDDVNMTMQAYFAHFRNMTIALIPRIKEMTYELTTFTEDYERTLSVLIRKLVELYGNKAPEEAKLLVEEARSSLSRCQAIVQSRVEIGLREMQDRFTEIQTDCDDIWETIKAESKNTAPGRIERIGYAHVCIHSGFVGFYMTHTPTPTHTYTTYKQQKGHAQADQKARVHISRRSQVAQGLLCNHFSVILLGISRLLGAARLHSPAHVLAVTRVRGDD